jgi:hypothetical protein
MHCVRNPHGAHFGDSVLSRVHWPRDQRINGGAIDPRIPVPTAMYNTSPLASWRGQQMKELNRLILLYKVVAMNQ